MKIDATDQILGRLASSIAKILQEKNKVSFRPERDISNEIIEVKNIRGIKVTGKKLKDKIYYRHSGHPGNLKSITLGKLFEKDPAKVLKLAVLGMLPKNKLRDRRMKRLRITTKKL